MKKRKFTYEEVYLLLKKMYMETAGSYNDYGKDAMDYEKSAEDEAEKLLNLFETNNKASGEKPLVSFSQNQFFE